MRLDYNNPSPIGITMTTKYPECPHCGNSLGDMWCRGRKLRQGCYDCGWKGKERTPEQQEIKTTRCVRAGSMGGHTFEVYDCYGHTLMASRSYLTCEEAEAALKRELTKDYKDAQPCTGVLWPATVTVQGTLIQS